MCSSLRIACLLVCLVGGRPTGEITAFDSRTDDGWESFPIAGGGDPILLPVNVSGQVRPFLLDTGASQHTVDTSLRELLGVATGSVAVAAKGGHDVVLLHQALCPRMHVGSFDVPSSTDGRVLLFDFAPIRQRVELDIRGVLAAPFFRDKLVEIDYDLGVLRLATRDRASAALGTAIPLRLDKNGVPWVDDIQVGGHNESFEVDTGMNNSLNFHRWLFQALCNDGEMTTVQGVSIGETIAGRGALRRGRLDWFSFGKYRHRDLLVHEANQNAIGLAYFARYVVTIDVTGGRIYLRPGRNFNQSDNVDCTGLNVSKIDGVMVVATLEKGTPAALGGLLQGDRIVRVNDEPCEGMRLMKFNQHLRDSAGKKLAVVVDRGGTKIELTLDVPTAPAEHPSTPQ